MKSKAQTATEYLIILAVVIIIALLVVGTLGGIPTIGSGSGDKAKLATLQTQDQGVTALSVTQDSVIVHLRNNKGSTAQIEGVWVDGIPCSANGNVFGKLLSSGQELQMTCTNVNSDIITSSVPDINVVWIETQTSAKYATYENTNDMKSHECLWADNLSGCLEFYIKDGCGTGTVFHTLTGLCFQSDLNIAYNTTYDANVNGFVDNWSMAMAYCDDLVLAGHDDWYLPSLNEFSFIRDLVVGNTTPSGTADDIPYLVDGIAGGSTLFDDYPHDANPYYWTSSGGLDPFDFAWFVYLVDGDGYWNSQDGGSSRAVCSRRN